MLKSSAITGKKFFVSFSLKKIDLFKILFLLFTFSFLFGTILICVNYTDTINQLNFLM